MRLTNCGIVKANDVRQARFGGVWQPSHTYRKLLCQVSVNLFVTKSIYEDYSRAQISDLFGAMARDYRQLYPRHELVVSEIYTGSLITFFKDALEYAAQTNTIVEFAKLVAQLFGLLRKVSTSEEDQKPTLRTVEKLLAIAVEAKASVELSYVGSTGDKILIRTTPSEARTLTAELRKLKRNRKKSRPGLFELSDRTEILRVIEQSGGDYGVIQMIGRLLARKRMARLARELANELEESGQHDAARALRDGIGDSPPELPKIYS
jgi:hypothetical protein